MTFFILITLLILGILFYCAGFKTTTTPSSHQKTEAQLLINSYQQNLKQNPQENAELQARLYHELKNLQKNQQFKNNKLPIWTIPLFLSSTLGLFFYWYKYLGGEFSVSIEALDDSLQPAITQTLNTDEMYSTKEPATMNYFCQSLLRHLNRKDNYQLEKLAKCYEEYGNYETASKVYRQIMRSNINYDKYALEYARTSLFANQIKKIMPNDVEKILRELYKKEPENVIAGTLLASGYLQSGQKEKALLIWRTLLQTTNPNHPLAPIIKETIARIEQEKPAKKLTELTVNLTIPQAIIDKALPESQVFLIVQSLDSPIPLLVKNAPVKLNQQITLNQTNTMTGQLPTNPELILRAKISHNGRAEGLPIAKDLKLTIKNPWIDNNQEKSPSIVNLQFVE